MREDELIDLKDAFDTALSYIDRAEAELDSVGYIEDYGWGFEEQEKKLRQLIKEVDEEIGRIHYREDLEVMRDSTRW